MSISKGYSVTLILALACSTGHSQPTDLAAELQILSDASTTYAVRETAQRELIDHGTVEFMPILFGALDVPVSNPVAEQMPALGAPVTITPTLDLVAVPNPAGVGGSGLLSRYEGSHPSGQVAAMRVEAFVRLAERLHTEGVVMTTHLQALVPQADDSIEQVALVRAMHQCYDSVHIQTLTGYVADVNAARRVRMEALRVLVAYHHRRVSPNVYSLMVSAVYSSRGTEFGHWAARTIPARRPADPRHVVLLSDVIALEAAKDPEEQNPATVINSVQRLKAMRVSAEITALDTSSSSATSVDQIANVANGWVSMNLSIYEQAASSMP